MNNKISALHAEQELSLLRADLALSSPQSYTLEEKRRICEDIDAKTQALDEAIREDFYSLPEESRALMLPLLKVIGNQKDDFWENLLL